MVYSLILRQLQEDGTISSETETQYLDQLGTDSFEEQRENFLGDGEAEQIAALTEEDEVSTTPSASLILSDKNPHHFCLTGPCS